MQKRRVVFSTNLGPSPEFNCDVCQDFEFYSEPSGKALSNTSLSAVKASAEHGCLCCCLLRDGLQNYRTEWQELNDEDVNISIDGDRARNETPIYDSVLITVIWTTGISDEQRSLRLEIYRTSEQSNLLPAFHRYSNEISEDPNSDVCFSIIQNWINNCNEKHLECSKTSSILPTRVINVDSDQALQNPFLYESHGETARYLALSHCWGTNPQMLRTTKANLASHKASISWSALSNTFRDALIVCQRLQIQYIWIDSLCIIQDDTDDWNAEAARMSDIYTRAYLVISATAGADGRFGCLFHRPPSYEIKAKNEDGQLFSARTRHSTAWNHKIFTDDVPPPSEPSFPSLYRGWTLQERLLSYRVLHFGPLEMVWDCRNSLHCECYGIENLAAVGRLSSVNLFTVNAWTRRVAKAVTKQQPYSIWRDLLNSYSGLKFTFGSDRLPALGGLAQAMSSLRLGSYAAGLWSEHLVEGLAWYCSNYSGAITGRGPYPYQAPTWSWASVRRPVKHYDEVEAFASKAQVLDVACNLVSGNEYGKVNSGKLTISGASVSAILSLRKLETDDNRYRGIRWLRFPADEGTIEWTGFYPDDLTSTTPREDEDIPVSCLLIGTWTSDRKREVSKNYVLVLKESPYASGTYERIGLTTGWEHWTQHIQEMQFIIV